MHVIIILNGNKDYKNKNGQNYIRVGLSAEREFYF